jgi:CRISPR/Cas system endoribonuclease Cas6 (RAMP superfamily)
MKKAAFHCLSKEAAQQQWQSLNGPALPSTGEQAVDLAKCMVAEYHLETVKRVFHDGCSTGYLGWIEYTCLQRDEAAIASLNALARLTFFAGLGYLTERGMGVTTVSITK